MTDIAFIMDLIYSYWPQKISYGTQEYFLTNEYLRRIKAIDRKMSHKQYEVLYHGLKKSVCGYELVEWNEEDSGCYEFKILLHKGMEIMDDDIELINTLGGARTDLRVFISVLGPYYYLVLERTRYDSMSQRWSFDIIDKHNYEDYDVYDRVNCYLTKQGLFKVGDPIARRTVENVETELKNINEATVFNCLFTDLVDV